MFNKLRNRHTAIFGTYLMKWFTVILCWFSTLNLFAQNSSDCLNAIPLTDSLKLSNVNKGVGDKLEIRGHKITNEFYFTKEHNTTWIRLDFTKDATFSFELIPQYPDDDFDFIIFSSFGKSTCDQISENIPVPLRSNLAKRNEFSGSTTGLKEGYSNSFAAAGESPNFSAPLSVSKGDTIYLVFDSPYGNKGGFAIKNTTVYKSDLEMVLVDTVGTPNLIKDDYLPAMTLRVIDELGEIVANPFVILKIGNKKIIDFQQNNVGELILREEIKGKKGQLIVTQKDFLQRAFSIEWNGERDTVATYQIEKIKMGSKLQFENINFAPNSSQILPESKSELEDLRTFLLNNPHISVEIGGHVNSMKRRNTLKLRKLSKSRARVIHQFLIDNGVPSNTISYKGYGNSQLIHTNPSSEKENKANRRVEVVVTEFN